MIMEDLYSNYSRSHPSSSSSSSPSSSSLHHDHPQPPPPPPPRPPPRSIFYWVSISANNNAVLTSRTTGADDMCSCLVILLTLCCFASTTIILGFYGSLDLPLAPNCSRLLQTNPFFVQDLKVKAASGLKDRTVMLHGFLRFPPLDVRAEWSESHEVSIPFSFHNEWIYYLNEHAQVYVSYSLKSKASQPLILVIAQGEDSLRQWLEDPLHPNTTLSWNLIYGNGTIELNVVKPSNYYIAVINTNLQEMEVQLNFKFHALLYNTSEAYYRCSLDNKLCTLNLFFLRTNVAVLTTSGTEQTGEEDEWYVELSYGPRWVSYIVGSGAMTLVILLAFKIFSNLLMFTRGNENQQTASEVITNRSALLANKDDDNLSLGSSYDSVSHDDDDEGEGDLKAAEAMLDGSCRSLCAICCDAQKDCFFLPCGHNATCFTCGRRMAEESGVCPICRRKMKKVRKIFTV